MSKIGWCGADGGLGDAGPGDPPDDTEKDAHPPKKCEYCEGYQQWCSICGIYTRTCCVDYGTCMCS